MREKGKYERCFDLPCGVNGNVRNCQEQQFSGNSIVSTDHGCERIKQYWPHEQVYHLALLSLPM